LNLYFLGFTTNAILNLFSCKMFFLIF